jgi:hypothetical protein
MRMLHQLAADHVQGLLRCPMPYAVAIAGKGALNDFSMAAIGKRMEDKTDRLFIRPARRTSHTRDADSKT